ncbi:MAG: hypothetical protein L0209_07015, partial [candidate division Zixibacteria bacterium]|nr:hypothetical protein [candidate division Zixibacteria bacterium]
MGGWCRRSWFTHPRQPNHTLERDAGKPRVSMELWGFPGAGSFFDRLCQRPSAQPLGIKKLADDVELA